MVPRSWLSNLERTSQRLPYGSLPGSSDVPFRLPILTYGRCRQNRSTSWSPLPHSTGLTQRREFTNVPTLSVRVVGWQSWTPTGEWGPIPTGSPSKARSAALHWYPDIDPNYRPPIIGDLPDKREDLATSQRFVTIFMKRYTCPRQYSATGYCHLLSTFSDVLALGEHARIGLLACITELINSRFDGTITRHDLYELWLAQTTTDLS